MIKKLFKKIAYLPELFRKYKVLRNQDLLNDKVSAKELEQYLYACNGIGRHRGYLRSLREGMCVDNNGDPIPWYTYPVIDQLAKWDFSNCEIFEFGCGNSTRWWAQRARSVVSVESTADWYQKIMDSKILPDNVTPILVRTDEGERQAALDRYVGILDQYGKFDVIVIDGEAENRTRYASARAAIPHLKTNGMIILDNSDWLPETCQLLRDAGLIEIDYCGNGPLNTHAETTSLFLGKDFQVRPLNAIHPGYTIGGLQLVWG